MSAALDQSSAAPVTPSTLARRTLLRRFAALGAGSVTFQRALADETAKTGRLTEAQISNAEWIAGLTLSQADREVLIRSGESLLAELQQLRAVKLEPAVLSCLRFDPEIADPAAREAGRTPAPWLVSPAADFVRVEPPGEVTDESLPWLPIRTLAVLLRTGRLTSERLVQLSLTRLKSADPQLLCVVSLLEESALAAARQADAELKAGHDRGLLHGIPWGAKDLLAVAGTKTTWGAPQYRDRVLEQTATVATRLAAAGAVLVAKLTTGALAMGDQWFGGKTRNPWNTEEGSSGSSAGSASAVSAGLVPFAIGSETLGSIVSPTKRCGVAGLRPTFGRISRGGCMPLSWSMDKLGPIARTVDDLGIILAATHGADSLDPCSVDRWFAWPQQVDLSRLRVGRVRNAKVQPAEQAALDHLQALGANIIDIELPRSDSDDAITVMLEAEACEVFRELSNAGTTEGLNAWPRIFQKARFVSAADYLHASRMRLQLMQKMAALFRTVDLYVGGDDLVITNLTGHPCIALPVLLQEQQPEPRVVCCTLTAGLYDEASLLALAKLIESRADVLKYHPSLKSAPPEKK
ncbi:MAG: amidase [Planctomycetaceae bacterium]